MLQDTRRILFHDCGDRVAQLLLLAITGSKNSDIPPQQVLLVNTHLLFPHNEFSSKIRMREMTKILGFVESYRQVEMCSDVCGRADVRVPVILAGDFNGTFSLSLLNYLLTHVSQFFNMHIIFTPIIPPQGPQTGKCISLQDRRTLSRQWSKGGALTRKSGGSGLHTSRISRKSAQWTTFSTSIPTNKPWNDCRRYRTGPTSSFER